MFTRLGQDTLTKYKIQDTKYKIVSYLVSCARSKLFILYLVSWGFFKNYFHFVSCILEKAIFLYLKYLQDTKYSINNAVKRRKIAFRKSILYLVSWVFFKSILYLVSCESWKHSILYFVSWAFCKSILYFVSWAFCKSILYFVFCILKTKYLGQAWKLLL